VKVEPRSRDYDHTVALPSCHAFDKIFLVNSSLIRFISYVKTNLLFAHEALEDWYAFHFVLILFVLGGWVQWNIRRNFEKTRRTRKISF